MFKKVPLLFRGVNAQTRQHISYPTLCLILLSRRSNYHIIPNLTAYGYEKSNLTAYGNDAPLPAPWGLYVCGPDSLQKRYCLTCFVLVFILFRYCLRLPKSRCQALTKHHVKKKRARPCAQRSVSGPSIASDASASPATMQPPRREPQHNGHA